MVLAGIAQETIDDHTSADNRTSTGHEVRYSVPMIGRQV